MIASAGKLKVLHITPTYYPCGAIVGGGERYVTNLCEAINRYACDSVSSELVSFSKKKEGRVERDHIVITVLRNEWGSSSVLNASNRKLFDLVDNADIIHIHQPFTGCGKIALLVAKQLRKIAVITHRGIFLHDSFAEWNGAELADLAICASRFDASFLKQYYKGPVHIVGGPVDTTRYVPVADGSSKKKTQVACVAQTLPQREIDRIVRGMPSGLEIVVCGKVGDQQHKGYLDSLVSAKPGMFAHECSDGHMIRLYQQSLAVIAISNYRDCYGWPYAGDELIGFTLLESMAVGTPVLCSRVGGIPELVIDGQTGSVFDSNEQLYGYLSDIEKRAWPPADMGPKCREHVMERYSMEVVGPRIAKIYQDIYCTRASAK